MTWPDIVLDRVLLCLSGIAVAWFTIHFIERRRIDHQMALELGKLRAQAMARQLQLTRGMYMLMKHLMETIYKLTPEEKAAPAPVHVHRVTASIKALQEEFISTAPRDSALFEPEVSAIFKRISEEIRGMPQMRGKEAPDPTILDSHLQRMKPLWSQLLKYFPKLRLPD